LDMARLLARIPIWTD